MQELRGQAEWVCTSFHYPLVRDRSQQDLEACHAVGMLLRRFAEASEKEKLGKAGDLVIVAVLP